MSRPDNIAYIISMPNGMDRWTHREVDALTRDGTKISIFPLRYAKGPYMPEPAWGRHYVFNRLGVLLRQPLYFLQNPGQYITLLREALETKTLINFFLGMDFAQEMRQRSIQAVHCVFGDHKLFIGYYVKKILGVKLSVALYGYDLRANPNWEMFKRAIGECDEIVANCDFNRDLLADVAGQEAADRTTVIRHYSLGPEYDSAGKLKVLQVGAFEERKGHDLTFNALKMLGEDADNIEVWVAGYQGPVDVQQLAIDLGVADKVRVFGWVNDEVVNLLYELCDVFCLPSRTSKEGISEGLPVALIEAMAFGKPVISTRLGGIPELVENVLIEENSVEQLAEALRQYATNPELRQQHSARNLEIVKQRFAETNVEAMRALLQGMVHGQ